MSQIKLKHSGGNSVIIAAPDSNPASDRTLKLPSDGDGTILTTNSATGKILQVVQVVKTDTASTSSQTQSNISGLSASITPTATSSKILITVQASIGRNNSGVVSTLRLKRDSTDLSPHTSSDTDGMSHLYVNDNASIEDQIINHLDSPNTTSATTYQVTWAVDGNNTIYLNRYFGGNYLSQSTITLMEVAA